AARAAREVVGSLLDSTHELAGVRQRTDLNASVREALLQLESARAAAGVEVVWDLAIDLPQVMANPSLMQRAFFNVANNAIQAMAGTPGGRCLFIRSRVASAETAVVRAGSDPPRLRGKPGPRIEFEFEDEGPGIPPGNLHRIFDPFFTTKPPGSGTGLGLSVATSCVRAHGGQIVAMNRPEAGARLVISLPLASGVSSAPAKASAPVVPDALPSIARPRILVVDDEDSIRILVNLALQDENEVVTCDCGRRALDLLASQEFDAVLCDLRLRDVAGREIYRWIRANRPALASHFLVITGDTHGDEGRGFLEEFRTPCVTKPFDLDELKTRVRELLGKRSAASAG
ncbi:MAG: response regulator, partial [Planctomycetes bacterium]|nr:response regulator [Planctomycetota bacterium]